LNVTVEPPPPPIARSRPRRSRSWVWIIPLAATAVVIGLAVRAIADRGPMITIYFSDAEGIQPGDTRVRHKDVDIGTVESISLTRDMSRAIVRARMRRSVVPHLTTNTRFWIVRPRVGVGGISGLSTLVSGSYIEMYPGTGEPQRSFVGLDEPLAPTPDIPGRSFTLHSSDLGSLIAGSPISFRGLPVGEVEGYLLDASGKQLNIYAFVRAPYEKLVNSQTRFWNSGGIDVSVGVQGVRFRASTWQQLLSGGVSFDTPNEALTLSPSAAATEFQLYDNQTAAERDPRGATLSYRVSFPGDAGDVGIGTSVQLQGTEIGQITDARLQYDDARQATRTLLTLQLDPGRLEIVHRRGDTGANQLEAVRARLERLVQRGLRAHLISANFLTGVKVVSLDMVAEAPAARVEKVEGYDELPSAGATDIAEILASVQSVLHHIDKATAGPELGHAIQEFDHTLTNLDQITAELNPEIKPLLGSLRATAEAAQRTLQAANSVLGTSAASGADLQQLIRQLTEATRSIRDLTDYLDRHPEALIRGRKGESP
jgi:paraquat-inducible protein B